MGFLTDKNAEVAARLREAPLDGAALAAQAAERPPALDLVAALRAEPPAVIAEVKRASPSAGRIAEVNPAAQAERYAAAGAAAISVLTDPIHFGGSLADLEAVAEAVAVPVLRKDFLLDPVQLLEARAAGASASLLIAASLEGAALGEMLAAAGELGIGVLLETHSEADLERALATDAEVIGVNARDLETLEVNVPRALAMLTQVPEDRVAVLESGISSREQVVDAVDAGATAILVGEALMRAVDPASKIEDLRGGER